MSISFDKKVALVANVKRNNSLTVDDEAEFDSPETIEAIAGSLRKCGLDVTFIEADSNLVERLKEEKIGFVFNIAEGIGGRDREAQVPGVLSLLGIPYSGSDALVTSLTLDKAMCKRCVSTFGVRTAPFVLVSPGHENDIPHDLEYPVIIKPNAEGSGKGISESCIAENRDELISLLHNMFITDKQDMLVETYLSGREFTVGLLGNGSSLRVLPPTEIVFERNTQKNYHVYSFKVKKEYEKYLHLTCPAEVPTEVCNEMQEMAKTVFNALGCYDFARVDLRMDAAGRPHFLEINPLPGLVPDYSDLTMSADEIGISYDEVIKTIVESALERTTQTNQHL